MLKINNLNKYYSKGKTSELHVINDVSLELPDNGLIAFLGPSGCGKTTLLNVIGGLDKADSGSINYGDFIEEKYNSKEIDKFRNEHISYIFQNYLLLEDLTIYDNLKLALEIMGVLDLEEVDKRITYTLKAVGMYKYRKKLAGSLSGGEKQRVAIARALLKNARIILADEPTGNLDRKNSIEVMNILKKISEKTLVLLVTHSKELAEFYADKILLLSDGKILKEKKGELDSLDNNSDDTIYLNDLASSDINIANLNIKLYKDDDKEIPLRIIKRQGKIYLDSPLEIKLIDNKIKVLNESHNSIKKEAIEDFAYDTSWYSDSLNKSKESFWQIFKYSFKNLFKSKKKSKFFNLLFVLIGILLAITSILFGNALNNNFKIHYVEDKYMIYNNEKNQSSLNDKLKNAFDKGYIKEVSNFYNVSFECSNQITYLVKKSYYNTVDLMPSTFITAEDMFLGRQPLMNEIVVTKGIADEIIKDLELPGYESLIDYPLVMGSIYEDRVNLTISGITKNKGEALYGNPNSGLFYQSGIANKFDFNYYSDISYELVEGRDKENDDEAVAFTNSGLKAGDTFDIFVKVNNNIERKNLKIVGIAKSSYEGLNNRGLILNSKELLGSVSNDNEARYLPSDLGEYEIIKGRDISGSNECLVSNLSGDSIGDSIGKYKVVGVYEADARLYGYSNIISPKDYNLLLVSSNINWGYFYFEVNDAIKLKEELGDYEFDTIYNVRKKMYQDDMRDTIIIYVSVAIILLVASALYIYFIMRSKLISSIYPTAVIRNIGASKKFIYRRFFIELLAITLVTNLLGYLGTYLFYYLFLFTIEEFLSISLVALNVGIFLLGIILIFVLNFLIGILPIRRYLKDTPAEATSKYDI